MWVAPKPSQGGMVEVSAGARVPITTAREMEGREGREERLTRRLQEQGVRKDKDMKGRDGRETTTFMQFYKALPEAPKRGTCILCVGKKGSKKHRRGWNFNRHMKRLHLPDETCDQCTLLNQVSYMI